MKGLIHAADIGTRLKPYTNVIPKELFSVGGKAVIEHVIDAFNLMIKRGRKVISPVGKMWLPIPVMHKIVYQN